MSSVVGICNSALIKLGASTIMALTDGSRNANLCKEQYDKLRDALLRSHNWNFAVARQKLAKTSGAPAFGYANKFQLPTDWLRTISVHGGGNGAAPSYRIEGRSLLSDSAEIHLRYVAVVADPNQMDAGFREALAWRLAIDLAMPVTQSASVQRQMEEGFKSAILRARSADAIEDFVDPMPESGWVQARS
ncbi:MAG: hypothetical protein K8F57_01330 [Alphaproteobacteria bacterium]|nr:hypothetical protein [Alphaproteobacteria bacterium]